MRSFTPRILCLGEDCALARVTSRDVTMGFEGNRCCSRFGQRGDREFITIRSVESQTCAFTLKGFIALIGGSRTARSESITTLGAAARRSTAKPGTPDFIREYNDAHAAIRTPKAGTLMTLIAEFKGSADYRRLAPSSIRAYTTYIKLIEDEFGDLPLAALNDLRVRGEFKTWRDRFANTPRKADYALVDAVAYPVVQQGSRPDRLQSVRGRRPAVHRRSR